MLDLLSDLTKALAYIAIALFTLICLPFVLLHVADNWNAPEYPHSGFSPECPEWIEDENTYSPTTSRFSAPESPNP